MSKNRLFGPIIVLSVLLPGCFAVKAPLAVVATEIVTASACPITEPALITPPVDGAIPETPVAEYFYANANQSLMASAWWWQQNERWHAGKDGNKVGWFKPSGAKMEITGRRLDAPADPMEAEVPAGYPTRFQASGLYFPSEGCWEVTAKAEGSKLVFVVEVSPQP